MDLIKISDNKLKIMLTPVDMQGFELSADELDCANMETREAFRSIMAEARNRIGFDTGGNQIYVQVYPSREGGCEMFVTKLGLLGPIEPQKDKARLSRPIKNAPRCKEVGFGFESMEHLLAACRRLNTLGRWRQSTAYRSDEGCYFLLLGDVSFGPPPAPDRDRILAVMGEYGKQQNADVIRLYIREHACLICEKNAVERLSAL